jgi:hypothetical protein
MKKILLALLLFGGVSSQVAFCDFFCLRFAKLFAHGFVCFCPPNEKDMNSGSRKRPGKKRPQHLKKPPEALEASMEKWALYEFANRFHGGRPTAP